MTTNIYRFRVSIQDKPQSDFTLHIFVEHDQSPLYIDLMYKVKQYYSQAVLPDISDYYMVIEKNGTYKYALHDDISLQHAFKSISNQDKLEIRLFRKSEVVVRNQMEINSDVPLVKPIFIRRPSQMDIVDLEEKCFAAATIRKDSGISLEQEMELFEKQKPKSKKLPALSNIITAQLSPFNTTIVEAQHDCCLPSPPQTSFYNNKSPIKLPGLSSIIPIDHTYNQYRQKKQLAPIQAGLPSLFDQRPLSPPSSASASPPPYFNPPANKKTTHKITRGGTAHSSQYICEHIIDKITGKKCSQSFRRSYDLSRHQSIHLKNRPLCYCQDCGKKFTRLDALRRHERIQGHNNKQTTRIF